MFHLPRAADATWWAAAAAMATLTVATIVGNAGVLSALWRARRSSQHYPLASLAAADLLVGVSVLPIAAARELFTFRLSWIICACWSTLDVLCCTASILSLCVLGWERWSGITDPLARARRFKWARILAASVWPVAVVVALPNTFVKSHGASEEEKACSVNTNPSYVFFSVLFSFYLPTCAMLVQYGQILRALAARPPIRAHRGQGPKAELGELRSCPESSEAAYSNVPAKEQQSKCPGTSENPQSAASKPPHSPAGVSARQRTATVTIIRLMSLFLICWSPFFIILPIDSLCECVHASTLQWFTWLGYTNSALNPVVYAAAATRVRRMLRSALTSNYR